MWTHFDLVKICVVRRTKIYVGFLINIKRICANNVFESYVPNTKNLFALCTIKHVKTNVDVVLC